MILMVFSFGALGRVSGPGHRPWKGVRYWIQLSDRWLRKKRNC